MFDLLWIAILKRAIAVLVMFAFGLHAYVQYRRQGQLMPTPQRWVFFAFSVAMMFGVVVNIDMLVLAAKLDIKRGPYNTGIYSLLVFILYIVFFGSVERRRYFRLR